MLRLLSTIRKDLLILGRDKGGLAVMFLMPMALITIMSLIQDAPFRDYMELKIPVVLVNKDTGIVGKSIENALDSAKMFDIEKGSFDEEGLKAQVKNGDKKIGIIIPENTTSLMRVHVEHFVQQKLKDAGLGDTTTSKPYNFQASMPDMVVVFAADAKKAFQASVKGILRQSGTQIETQLMMMEFNKAMNNGEEKTGEEKQPKPILGLREVSTIDNPQEALKLNSVQHNVPAWTIFGMFFIVISLSGSVIKERDEGSFMRIRTMPGSYLTVIWGKISAYLFICMIQCVLMIMVGLYLLPMMGLPKLLIGNNVPAIAIVALCGGLAATGFGMMVGTIFKTHQQSSTFGSVSVVILAAVGGIWVPVYVMPEAIRALAEFSPLYWGLSAFHKLFLNNGSIATILPYALKLLLFFIFTIGASFTWNKLKSK